MNIKQINEELKKYLNKSYQLPEGIVDTKQYNTPYGKFIIITNELKRRKRNIITSKIEIVPVRTVIGYFKDYPKAIEFWVAKDNGSRYLTSSQGDSWNDLAQYLNVDTYNDLLDQVYESVLDCFRNYYNDFNIQ